MLCDGLHALRGSMRINGDGRTCRWAQVTGLGFSARWNVHPLRAVRRCRERLPWRVLGLILASALAQVVADGEVGPHGEVAAPEEEGGNGQDGKGEDKDLSASTSARLGTQGEGSDVAQGALGGDW